MFLFQRNKDSHIAPYYWVVELRSWSGILDQNYSQNRMVFFSQIQNKLKHYDWCFANQSEMGSSKCRLSVGKAEPCICHFNLNFTNIRMWCEGIGNSALPFLGSLPCKDAFPPPWFIRDMRPWTAWHIGRVSEVSRERAMTDGRCSGTNSKQKPCLSGLHLLLRT